MGKGLRSIKYLFNRYILRRPFLVAESDLGTRFVFKTEDCIGRHIYKYGVYEKPVTDLVTAIPFERGDVVIDVGANIGWYSLLVEKVSPPGVVIYAFEPEPLNYSLLQENLKLNGSRKVIPVKKALGERRGVVKMFLYPNKNRGRHSLIPMYDHGSVEVEMTTLDDFASDHGISRVKLLKIDVEGYEYMVLRGSRRTLKNVDFMILEVAPEYMKRGGISIEEFSSFLASLNFRMFLIGEGELEEIEPEDLLKLRRWVNLFLHKRDLSFSLRSFLSS